VNVYGDEGQLRGVELHGGGVAPSRFSPSSTLPDQHLGKLVQGLGFSALRVGNYMKIGLVSRASRLTVPYGTGNLGRVTQMIPYFPGTEAKISTPLAKETYRSHD
jgi:hypothetical protein